jgi:hypothetical protein
MKRQDLRMILLDNYMLLTRDEEQGRLVVVSRVSPFGDWTILTISQYTLISSLSLRQKDSQRGGMII